MHGGISPLTECKGYLMIVRVRRPLKYRHRGSEGMKRGHGSPATRHSDPRALRPAPLANMSSILMKKSILQFALLENFGIGTCLIRWHPSVPTDINGQPCPCVSQAATGYGFRSGRAACPPLSSLFCNMATSNIEVARYDSFVNWLVFGV